MVTNIYSDIRSYRFFLHKYIRTSVRVKLVCTNSSGESCDFGGTGNSGGNGDSDGNGDSSISGKNANSKFVEGEMKNLIPF